MVYHMWSARSKKLGNRQSDRMREEEKKRAIIVDIAIPNKNDNVTWTDVEPQGCQNYEIKRQYLVYYFVVT